MWISAITSSCKRSKRRRNNSSNRNTTSYGVYRINTTGNFLKFDVHHQFHLSRINTLLSRWYCLKISIFRKWSNSTMETHTGSRGGGDRYILGLTLVSHFRFNCTREDRTYLNKWIRLTAESPRSVHTRFVAEKFFFFFYIARKTETILRRWRRVFDETFYARARARNRVSRTTSRNSFF